MCPVYISCTDGSQVKQIIHTCETVILPTSMKHVRVKLELGI